MENHEKLIAENYAMKTENENLKARVNELDEKYRKACKAYCMQKKTIESKDRAIERLQIKILNLVNDYV